MLRSCDLWRDVLQLIFALAFDMLQWCYAWDKVTAVELT